MRLTVNGERAGDFSIFVKARPGNWNSKMQLIAGTPGSPAIGTSPQAIEETFADNERLLMIRTAIKECVNQMLREGGPLSARSLKARYLAAGQSQPTLMEVLAEYMAHKRARRLSKSTLKMLCTR